MLSVSTASSKGSYYTDSANYYDEDTLAPPAWFGKGAEALGLSGKVETTTYGKLYEGILPTGETLGRTVGNTREHAGGWDLTFSAPKSVSLVAMVGGDRRLIDAVNEAAKEAVAWVEEHAAKSRITVDGKTVSRPTGNLVVAMYPHDLTREQDPGLHIHAVVMNATQGPDGTWRSLDSRFFYWMAKEGGLRFQQILALKCRDLGYEILSNVRDGTFELAGIPRQLIEDFSTRSKQIIENLRAKGLTRDTATTLERRAATLETRAPKKTDPDRASLARGWGQTFTERGINPASVSSAANAQASNPAYHQQNKTRDAEIAKEAVRTAGRILAEKAIVFADVDLVKKADEHALVLDNRREIHRAIRQLDQEGFLQSREIAHFNPVIGEHVSVQGWTTVEAVAVEKDILDREWQGRQSQEPILTKESAKAVADKAGEDRQHWERDHQLALFSMLTSRDRMTAVDAPIGSAPARHVVSTYLAVAERRGYEVRMMTPSAAGAQALNGLMAATQQGRAVTIAAHLAALNRSANQKPQGLGLSRLFASDPPQVWLVADAARLGMETTRDLFKAASEQKARVILMDQSLDGRSFGSKAFEQLRQTGMATYRVPGHQGPDINELHQAVAALLRHEPAEALGHIEKSGGQIITIAPKSRSRPDQQDALKRRQIYIADRYAEMNPEERAATRVLDLTHRGKAEINDAIRERLIRKGELTGPTLKAEVLLTKSLTPTERKQAISYQSGDVVRFGSAHQRRDQPAIVRGDYLRVREVRAETGRVILQKDDGQEVQWEPARWGSRKAAAFRPAEREFAVGEHIVWTRKDDTIGVANQRRDTIISVDPDKAVISMVRNGQVQEVDLSKPRHLDHAYADTVRAQVSSPAERVIAHLPAGNVDMTNLKSIIDVAIQTRHHLTIVTENSARLVQAVEDRPGQGSTALDGAAGITGAARDAVTTAAAILAERNAVFSARELDFVATRQGIGQTSSEDITAAIAALAETGQLIRRETDVFDPDSRKFVPGEGWTTAAALRDEKMMLATEKRVRHSLTPILTAHEARDVAEAASRASRTGKSWNAEQLTAAVGLLSSPHAVTGLQGLAGTAKTSTVLFAVARAAKASGHEVSAMAPTTDAGLLLAEAVGGEGKTVARHLSEVSNVRPAKTEKEPVWIVDEASMVSAKNMRDLIRVAEQHDARLLLTFDVLQLGSVGAGRAAGQLIENGLKTYYLDNIVRQADNQRMRDAVYDMITRQPEQAFRNLRAAGGTISAVENEAERHAAMAKEYVSRPPDFRKETIMIDPTREGVAAIATAVRDELAKKGELTGKPLEANLLVDTNMTTPEHQTATSYRVGQIVRVMQNVRFHKQGKAVKSGTYLEVQSARGAEVTLRSDAGRLIRWEPRQQPVSVEVLEAQMHELKTGDRIRWTGNNKDIDAVSGRTAKVVGVNPDRMQIDIRHDDDRQHRLDLTNPDHQRFTYAYAVTTQRAQGATGYVIANLPSYRVNTVNAVSAYVMISRTPDTAHLFTDGLEKLTGALHERPGEQMMAHDEGMRAGKAAEEVVRDMVAAKFIEPEMASATPEKSVTSQPEHVVGGRGPTLEM